MKERRHGWSSMAAECVGILDHENTVQANTESAFENPETDQNKQLKVFPHFFAMTALICIVYGLISRD